MLKLREEMKLRGGYEIESLMVGLMLLKSKGATRHRLCLTLNMRVQGKARKSTGPVFSITVRINFYCLAHLAMVFCHGNLNR